MVKERLDVLLTVRRLAESRERAKTTIMAGLVLVDGQKVDKAGTMVKTDADIRLLGDALPYVSRGGWKLAKALDTFGISLTGRIMADMIAEILQDDKFKSRLKTNFYKARNDTWRGCQGRKTSI